jgi:hypothetical protein
MSTNSVAAGPIERRDFRALSCRFAPHGSADVVAQSVQERTGIVEVPGPHLGLMGRYKHPNHHKYANGGHKRQN